MRICSLTTEDFHCYAWPVGGTPPTGRLRTTPTTAPGLPARTGLQHFSYDAGARLTQARWTPTLQGTAVTPAATLGQVAWEGGIWGAEVIATAADAFVAGKAVSGLRVVSGIAEAQSWKGVRAMLGRQGVAEPGQWVHHWGIEQAETRGNALLTWFSNQPWNLVPLDVGVAAELTDAGYSATQGFSRLSHLVHGHQLSIGMKWNVALRFWFGTPSWVKAALLALPGNIAKIAESFNEESTCQN